MTGELKVSDSGAEQRTQEIRHHLKSLGQLNWSMWGSAVVLILSLTGGVASFFVSKVSDPDTALYQFQSRAVYSLFGLVLLFSVYTLYQQLNIKRSRIQLAEQIEIATQQQKRAEEPA